MQEAVRDTWTWRWLDAFVRDVRYAIRSLTRSWGFALGASVVLALAIGANVAIFSVVDTVLLQPLGYPDADRIVSIETLWTNTGRVSPSVSGPDFLDWQAHNDVFEKMAVYYSGDTGGTDDSPVILGDRATFANPRYVSADFFAVFGQAASAGRLRRTPRKTCFRSWWRSSTSRLDRCGCQAGILLAMRSATAAIVFEGFKPSERGMTEPSATKRLA